MRRSKQISSAALRFTAIYFALYLLSTAVLLALVYGFAWTRTQAELDGRLDDRIAWLSRGYMAGGATKVVEDIRAQIDAQVRTRTFYRFVQNGETLAGNLPTDTAPLQIGRQTLMISAEREGDRLQLPLRARTVRLDDASLLTVGVDGEQLDATRKLFILVAVGAVIGSLLMAPAIGYYMSRSLLKRLDLLNLTIASILAGDFSRRVLLRGTNDEFDALSQRFNEMLETIQRLMGDLRLVANNVAHDLRTPLSRLQLRLEELRDRYEDSNAANADIDQAIDECRGIVEAFNAILKLSEIESEQTRTSFGDCNLSDLVDAMAEAYGGIADEEGRSLHVDIQPHVHVRGDKHLLLQMLSNLLENAFKHTPAGTALRLRLQGRGEAPVIVIEDEGPGIPEAARTRVFSPFHRLEQSRTTPGSGLGLSLVLAIARRHDIRIALSDANPGLRVTLTFSAQSGPIKSSRNSSHA
jgi:signal transduction histidine kinase